MINPCCRVNAKTPAAQIETAAEINIFVITTAKCGIEAAGFQKCSAADQDRVTAQIVSSDVMTFAN